MNRKVSIRVYAVIALVMIVAMALPWVVLADNVTNSLDDTVDTVAETMPLNVDGANGSTTLYVIATDRGDGDGDTKQNCNLNGNNKTFTVSVNSSDSSVATVSPTVITFVDCGVPETLSVTPLKEGSTTISLSETSNSTDGTFNLAPATFTVNVTAPTPPNTAPQVSIDGVTGGASYGIGSVPAATCQVTDVEDGNSSFAATLGAITGQLSDYGLGAQTASCSYTDGGGLMASSSVTYSIVDTTDPVITFVSRTAANSFGWNKDAVVVTWSCQDNVAVDSENSILSQTLTAEGADQSAEGTCLDVAGNSASDTQTGINIDKTVPTASASALPTPNANGWNNGNVTVSFSGKDNLSGIDSCDAAVVLSDEGEDQSASGTCTDKAGNVSASATASGINIDKTTPSVALVGGPADGGTYYFGFVPAAPTCSASDALSGLDGSCNVSGYSAVVGNNQTVTASATDKAGNSGSASATYDVLAWTLNGFYQPVDMGGVFNVVKGGSTVPLKFEVFAGPTELTNTSAVKSFVQTKIACDGTAPADDIAGHHNRWHVSSLRHDGRPVHPELADPEAARVSATG